MTYQEILKQNLSRRLAMNPRYSLRAFADLIGLAPSKVSEILNGKKGLSPARAEAVANRLKLKGREREIFLLSAEAQHSRIKKSADQAKERLNLLIKARSAPKTKTNQKNAWYFGAVKAVARAGLPLEKIPAALGLTPLQVENAHRFLQRIRKYHPERVNISYEPTSLFKKITEDYSTHALKAMEAEFAFLTPEQAEELTLTIQEKIVGFGKSKAPGSHFYLFSLTCTELCKKEDLC